MRCPRNENGTCHAVLSSRPRSVMPMTPRSRNNTRPGTGNLFRSTSIRMLSCDQISPSSSRGVKPSRRRRSAACGVLSVKNDSPSNQCHLPRGCPCRSWAATSQDGSWSRGRIPEGYRAYGKPSKTFLRSPITWPMSSPSWQCRTSKDHMPPPSIRATAPDVADRAGRADAESARMQSRRMGRYPACRTCGSGSCSRRGLPIAATTVRRSAHERGVGTAAAFSVSLPT